MKLPVQVVFRDIDRSEAIEAGIRKQAAKLEQICEQLISCRVAVEALGRHTRQGRLYAVHVDVKVPGDELISTRHQHQDTYVAVHNAFAAVKRQVQDYVRKRHAHERPHEPPANDA